MTTGNQSSSQQSSPGQTGGNQSPPHNIGGSIPTIPTVTITYVAPTVPTVQKVSTGIPYQWVTPGTVVNTAYLWNNPAVVGDLEFWVESQRAKLSDDERARLDSIDETMKALEDPAWYFWPTWDQALQCGRHGTEQELRRLIPTLMWTNQQPMNEIYTPIAQILQDTIKKNFPLEGNYWVAFKDRPLDNLSFIENLSIHKIVYLVGEKGGGMDFDCKRWPKRGNSYRHIMFPINKYLWIKKLRHFFKDLNLPPPHGPVLNPDPFRAFMCRGYFNSFVKPVVECQPSVGKAYKITISIPILNVTLGSKLIPRKTAERVLRHHPSFLRAPGYEYAETYIDQDGKEQPKPGVWIYGSALDDPSIGFSGDYDGSNFGTPPTVFTGRTLFEYHHPKMDALILDLRQTMRRGNRGHYDDDEFLVVEQLWAVIIPTKETLITFQSMKPAVIPGQVGGFNNYMFEPTAWM
ncbi:hypothetical protein DFP73DRAFT_247904 [Morchella snyderi]|nr:hypothetical protein DFP73DRAFT_247904 [Morchella snyderi]